MKSIIDYQSIVPTLLLTFTTVCSNEIQITLASIIIDAIYASSIDTCIVFAVIDI